MMQENINNDLVVLENNGLIDSVVNIVDFPITHPHCFASVQFFDAQGDPVSAGAGTVTITVKPTNSNVFESVIDGAIDAASPTTVSWAANTAAIRATPDSIAGAATYKLVVTANRS